MAITFAFVVSVTTFGATIGAHGGGKLVEKLAELIDFRKYAKAHYLRKLELADDLFTLYRVKVDFAGISINQCEKTRIHHFEPEGR